MDAGGAHVSRQSDEHYTPRRYRVRHATTYTYDDDVTGCYERGFLAPRSTGTQQVESHELAITPAPGFVAEHVDHFGNASHYVEVLTPHRRLQVVKESVLHVDWSYPELDRLDQWTVGDAARQMAEGSVDPVDWANFTLPSELVGSWGEVRSYAATLVNESMPLGRAFEAVYEGIYRDFRFASGVTSVRTTLPELLELRQGVCQDFTHLALGVLRAYGIPARYVSGYIETSPPPGKPKLAGSDASHAWVAALAPDGTWVDMDPTNDHFADSRYIVTAWGRDFRDVSPLKGVIYTESKNSTLEVAVDVTRL